MFAKEKERIKARHMRQKGASLHEIASKLRVAKSSVSTWVRDIHLTQSQTKFLAHSMHTREVVKKRVATRLAHENARRTFTIQEHKKFVPGKRMTPENLLILGTALYWAEGGKSHKNRSFNFTNSDPIMIKVMRVFLKNICKVPGEKLRGHIHIHAHLNKQKAERYWSAISQIPRSQFYKTTQVINRASRDTRDTLPHGTFSIQIGSTNLFLKMLAWIEAVSERVALV